VKYVSVQLAQSVPNAQSAELVTVVNVIVVAIVIVGILAVTTVSRTVVAEQSLLMANS
jgi:hypothetical protein